MRRVRVARQKKSVRRQHDTAPGNGFDASQIEFWNGIAGDLWAGDAFATCQDRAQGPFGEAAMDTLGLSLVSTSSTSGVAAGQRRSNSAAAWVHRATCLVWISQRPNWNARNGMQRPWAMRSSPFVIRTWRPCSLKRNRSTGRSRIRGHVFRPTCRRIRQYTLWDEERRTSSLLVLAVGGTIPGQPIPSP